MPLAALALLVSSVTAIAEPGVTSFVLDDPAVNKAEAAPKPAWPTLENPDTFSLSIAPRVWYASPSGKIKLPATSAGSNRVRVENLNLDASRISPYAEATIRAGDFRFTFSGAAYDVERSATADSAFRIGDVNVGVGDVTDSKFDLSTFNISAGYRFYEKDFGKDGGNEAGRTVLRLEGEVGARLYNIDIKVSSGATTSSFDGFFGEIFAGVRAELQIVRNFSLDCVLNVGGFSDSDRSVTSLDGSIAFTWRPVEGVGVQIGWRQLISDLKEGSGDDEFEYEGGMAGLFAGVVIRF